MSDMKIDPNELVYGMDGVTMGELLRTVADATVTAPAETQLPHGCHRSHPHEDMDAECERLTIVARENNRRANEPADEKSTQAENELIAERLLNWKRGKATGYWYLAEGPENGQFFCRETPSFTTWHDCGLILEALNAKGLGHYVDRLYEGGYRAYIDKNRIDHVAATAPLAVRSAALSYLRSLESQPVETLRQSVDRVRAEIKAAGLEPTCDHETMRYCNSDGYCLICGEQV